MKNVLWVLTVVVGFSANGALADQFHYNNILIGDRAQGLGGAFTAVADDASGVVYNPAGIAFALSNDISGSANAFIQKKITYKEAAFGEDFVEKSSGTIAPFVGGLGKLDSVMPGLTFAFGIYSPDSELKDQNDLIETSAARFHRTANVRASTDKIGVALGKRVSGSFAVGFSLTWLKVSELAQIYQDSQSIRQGYEVDENGERTQTDGADVARTDCCFRQLTQNVRELLEVQAIEPGFGLQYAFGGQFSVGFAVKQPLIVYEKFKSSFERTITYSDANGDVLDKDETGYWDLPDEQANSDAFDAYRSVDDGTAEDNPLKAYPMEIRTGFAWFASPKLLISTDVVHYTAAESGLERYDRDAVTNFALGTEYYLSASWPMRVGIFTNNDARPEPSSGDKNQRDSIDYIGGSLFFAMVQPNSQIALGYTYQSGSGKAQKVAGSTDIQDIEAESSNIGFSVSHNF